MRFEVGLCSVSFRGEPPESILANMQKAGIFAIEWGSDVHAPQENREQLHKIARLQQEYGIRCCSYGTYFRLGVMPMDALLSYIEAAKMLGTNTLRLWCGNKNSEEYAESEKTALFDACKEAAAIAEKHGVVLCMECHANSYTNTKESAYALMQAVASDRFRMYWQPNSFASFAENTAYAKRIADYTEHIHVFHWQKERKLSMCEGKDCWKEYLSCFDGVRMLLLEFMPDDRLESLKTEAEALKEIIQ